MFNRSVWFALVASTSGCMAASESGTSDELGTGGELAKPAAVPAVQTFTALASVPVAGPGAALVLTDGRVITEDADETDWWSLTPDLTGSYGERHVEAARVAAEQLRAALLLVRRVT